MHLGFVLTAANLKANTYGLKGGCVHNLLALLFCLVICLYLVDIIICIIVLFSSRFSLNGFTAGLLDAAFPLALFTLSLLLT